MSIWAQTAKGLLLTNSIALLCFCQSYGQSTNLQIDSDRSIENIVQSLEGPGVDIFNITTSIPSELDRSVAFFNDVLGIMDIDKGLLMTNGTAFNARGPNNASDKSFGSGTASAEDRNLSPLVPDEILFDIVIIEFDIIGTFDELSFNYVFGSEEYPEFVGSEFNDVFGFFISGPGIAGEQNLAVIGNNEPVSINTINAGANSGSFVSNGTGDNPALNFYLQYDGYTTKLQAKATIIPCETYHIKLAIADAGDDIYDAGVFIEQESFITTSSINIDVNYEHDVYDYAIEECNKGFFTISRSGSTDVSLPLDLEFTLTGTAENGTDYTFVPGTVITIPANQLSTTIEIDALQDNIPEDTETVVLEVITGRCDQTVSRVTAEMPLRDSFEYLIPEAQGCSGVEVALNESPPDRYSFQWEDNPLLSCTDCPSPVVNIAGIDTFLVDIIDNIAGCRASSEAVVSSNLVDVFFRYSGNDNYTSLDAFFENLTTGAERYEWTFGDGQGSSEFEPVHTYDLLELQQEARFTITLTAFSDSPLCSHSYDTTIFIRDPFFIPNVITPNGDLMNETLEVRGIERGVWRMEIYNRWGQRVYQSNNYNNDWSSQGLSAGVYYYKLTNPIGDREFKGWVQTIK